MEKLIEKPEEAAEVVTKFLSVTTALSPLESIKDGLEIARRVLVVGEPLFAVNVRKFKDHDIWVSLGSGTCELLGWKKQPNPKEFTDFYQLLVDKHKLYGAEPLVRWGSIGIMIRIDSKLHRYTNLILDHYPSNPNDESIQDTLLDILGYCVLGYIMTNKKVGGQ